MDMKQTDNGENIARICQLDRQKDSPAMFPLTFADAVYWFCLSQEAFRSELSQIAGGGNS